MPRPKVSHDYKCDKCAKQAKYNIQQNWQLFSIENDGEFEEDKTWEGDTNEFYCERCAKLEGII